MRALLASGLVVVCGCSAPLRVFPGESLDFGVLELGASNDAPLTFTSQSSWALVSVESTGAPVSFPPFVEGPGVFTLKMDPAFGLTGPFVREDFVVEHFLGLRAGFDPPAVSVETPFTATVTLTFVSKERVTERVKFSLRGVALPFTCGRVQELRFGGVALGDERSLPLELQNPRDELDQVSLFLRQPSNFALTPSGTFTLAAREVVSATVSWRPQRLGFVSGSLDVGVSRLCPTQEVLLTGQALNPVDIVSEATFPLTPVGGSSSGRVRLRNFMRRQVVIETLTLRDGQGVSAEFSAPSRVVLPAATLEAGALLPADFDVPITFTPTRVGGRDARLSMAFDLPLMPFLDVYVVGEGGGPDLALAPRTLTLSSQGGGAAVGELRLSNVGTPTSVLHLGTPAFAVRALSGASPDEVCLGSYKPTVHLCLGTLPGYDTNAGLVTGTTLSIPVRVTPQSPGPRRFAVDFFSDDFDSPVTTVELVVP